jgi:hypothetical protein
MPEPDLNVREFAAERGATGEQLEADLEVARGEDGGDGRRL